jgi:hypothetical protein
VQIALQETAPQEAGFFGEETSMLHVMQGGYVMVKVSQRETLGALALEIGTDRTDVVVGTSLAFREAPTEETEVGSLPAATMTHLRQGIRMRNAGQLKRRDIGRFRKHEPA